MKESISVTTVLANQGIAFTLATIFTDVVAHIVQVIGERVVIHGELLSASWVLARLTRFVSGRVLVGVDLSTCVIEIKGPCSARVMGHDVLVVNHAPLSLPNAVTERSVV